MFKYIHIDIELLGIVFSYIYVEHRMLTYLRQFVPSLYSDMLVNFATGFDDIRKYGNFLAISLLLFVSFAVFGNPIHMRLQK